MIANKCCKVFPAMAVVICMLLLSACGSGENTEMNKNAMGNQGPQAPMFELMSMKGNPVKHADYDDQKVYVKYWASWCSICLAGLKELNTLAGQDHEFEVITIVTPHYKGEKSAKDFKAWFSQQPYSNLTVLFDEKGEWAKQFGLRGFPSSYYIGSDGALVSSSIGHVDNETIINEFQGIH